MKILVLGGGGMAGHVIATYLGEKNHQVSTISATNKLNSSTTLIDVTNITKLKRYLDNHSFDIVINCIAILVKQSEERKDLASFLNGYFPHFLENYYRNSKTRLIHISSDGVFSGKNAPYKEDSRYDCEIFYGYSKALGEVINDKDLTFRTSIIGPDMHQKGVSLFNWFYSQTGEIGGYDKTIWNGITTIELAKAIEDAIQQNIAGLYHLVPDANISKYSLLKLFAEEFNRKDITVTPNSSAISDHTLINTRTDFSHKVPPYKVMVKEMHDWISAHEDLYKHYTLLG